MKFILQLLIVSSVAILIGCEGNTDYTWRVTNSSSSDVKVWTTSGFSAIEDSVIIESNSTETIGIFNQLGGNSTEQLPEQAFSSLIVVNATEDTMLTSYIDPGSWTSVVEQIKKAPSQYEHTYTFVVEDSDF